MRPSMKLGALALASGLVAGCGGSDSDDPQAQVRVVHASSNAPAVNASLDGSEAVSALAFATATDYLSVDAGDYTVTVDAIIPGGNAEVINAPVTLAATEETTILAVGNVGGSGDSALGPLVVTAPDEDPASDAVRAQVVHGSEAAAAAGPLDVYVTAPGADPGDSDVEPLGTFEFRGSLGPVTVPAGDYRIRVTPEGTPGAVVFDSGTVALAGGSDLVITAIDNSGPANGPRNTPVRLLVAPEGGDSFVLVDAAAGAALGAGHLSADTGDVDVYLDEDFANPVAEDLSFPGVSAFLDVVPAATVDVDVGLADSAASAVGLDGVTLEPGARYTAYAVGQSSGGTPALELIVGTDDVRPVATEARLRVVHGASGAVAALGGDGEVDVYVAPDGTVAGDLAGLEPTLADFAYPDITGFLSVAAGDYEVFVTAAGTTTVVIGPVGLSLADGDVTTAIARDVTGSIGSDFAILPVDETAR